MTRDLHLDTLRQLIEFDSVSCNSNVPVATFLEKVLKNLGFSVELIPYQDKSGCRKLNLLGKLGTGTGGLAYFAHNDVVPAEDWSFAESGPFSAHVQSDRVFGRGSCDMKGSIAAMLQAVKCTQAMSKTRPLYFVCTADEEVGFLGAKQVVKRSDFFREMVRHQTKAIIGEPTSMNVVHAHKGIIGLRIYSYGKSAHSSTNLGKNANLDMIPFLSEMKRIYDETSESAQWRDERFHPPTITWNIGINDYTHAYNVTPGRSVCTISFRPMPGQLPEELIQRASDTAKRMGLDFEIDARGDPFLTPVDNDFVKSSLDLLGQEKPLTVAYGTDGGEFRELKNMIVLGPGDIAQAHTSSEYITLQQLSLGVEVYQQLIEQECG